MEKQQLWKVAWVYLPIHSNFDFFKISNILSRGIIPSFVLVLIPGSRNSIEFLNSFEYLNSVIFENKLKL